MTTPPIRFDDGAGYEQMMGIWSRLVGEIFIDWVTPSKGWRWLDIGCGNGAFTEVLTARCAPSSVCGIDPSEPQLAYARSRSSLRAADFTRGDAQALPFPNGDFDTAVMALVLFFVPDAAKAVTEMARVVKDGGMMAAYVWNVAAGGMPQQPIHAEMQAMGLLPPSSPGDDRPKPELMRELWASQCDNVEMRDIVVQRRFDDFDVYWDTMSKGSRISSVLGRLGEGTSEVKERARVRLPADASGHVTCTARAVAIKGRVRPRDRRA